MTSLHSFHVHTILQIMPSNTSLHAHKDDDSDSEVNSKESFETQLFPVERRIHQSAIRVY